MFWCFFRIVTAWEAWVARAWCVAHQVSHLEAACAVWHPTAWLQPPWPGQHCPRGFGLRVVCTRFSLLAYSQLLCDWNVLGAIAYCLFIK